MPAPNIGTNIMFFSHLLKTIPIIYFFETSLIKFYFFKYSNKHVKRKLKKNICKFKVTKIDFIINRRVNWSK